MPPQGLFGIPHGILSSADEKIALVIGIVALLAAVFYDGDRDVQPLSGAAAVGVVVALAGSFALPAAVSNEWHIAVVVVLILLGGIVLVYSRN